ncbi:MAG: GNAT family N-acetyltransferase [Chloroflexota bacterium]|nr:GNAT family N-acetyltransferase [Chloroflexota bacterium]
MTPGRVPVWPLLPPSVYVRQPSKPLPFAHLVPAYHCGTEVKALVQAACHDFYEVWESLEANQGELDSRVADDVSMDAFPGERLPRFRFTACVSRAERRFGHSQLLAPAYHRVEAITRPIHDTPAGRRADLQLERIDSFEAIHPEWMGLAEASDNVFATWEWNSIWWKHFGQGRTLLAYACRDADGRLLAVLPLYLWAKRPLRVIRFVGHGPADQLAPICRPEDRDATAYALLGALDESPPGWDILLGEQFLATEGWRARLGAKVVGTIPFPILRCPSGGWEQFLASRSAHFRKKLRHRERTLERTHALRYRLADDPLQLQEDLDLLFRLHDARWSDGSSFTGAREAFHREFAAVSQDRGWLRLWFLELDGHPVAAWYGFRFGTAESYYQAGRDPVYDRLSVGFMLVMQSIRAAFDDGMREYRFLRGGEAYKYRLANEDPGLEILARSRGAAGAAVVATGVAAYRVPSLRNAARERLQT